MKSTILKTQFAGHCSFVCLNVEGHIKQIIILWGSLFGRSPAHGLISYLKEMVNNEKYKVQMFYILRTVSV